MTDFKIDNINNFRIFDLNFSEPVAEFSGVTIESEIDPSSLTQEKLSLTGEATFECELTDFSPLLGYKTNYCSQPLELEYYTPVMVQARWHKKNRINKKWLKRYGMKEDSIRVKAKASSVTFDTERANPYEIECNMRVEDAQYEFRPDQMRRSLKIAMYY